MERIPASIKQSVARTPKKRDRADMATSMVSEENSPDLTRPDMLPDNLR